MFNQSSVIGVVGSGAMGSGIAQVAATAGHKVIVFDNNAAALSKAENNLKSTLQKLVEKQKMSAELQSSILGNIAFEGSTDAFKDCGLVIEAIVENLDVKKNVFA
jgi:3-hydroxybutyryl-CoA dehydrogenase